MTDQPSLLKIEPMAMNGILKLAAQSVLELAAVGWAGWELWSLRDKKPKAPPPPSDPPRHPVGEHPLDDGGA